MGLRSYIAKRLVYLVVLVFFVISLNFLIFELMPGSPADFFINPIKAREGQIEAIEESWGFNQPLHIRYFRYVRNMITWQFGDSIGSGKPVADEMVWRLQYTLTLLGTSTILSIILGVFIGVYTAHKRGTIFDDASVMTSIITFSLPTFWMGMLFKLVFAYQLRWFPAIHAYPDAWTIRGNWPTPIILNLLNQQIVIPSLTEISARLLHMVLPVVTLTLFLYGNWVLLTRATILETLTEDYIVTARAKGLKERTILFKHALKNASLPLITSAALAIAYVFGGAIITETVFVWPGLGDWTWRSITIRDIPALQAIFYVSALLVIVANFIADMLYGVIDPRIKYG